MATLTSTGAVNLTSSTNWSPAQIPAAGDDLVIGAHTLTLDADFTGAGSLNTVTFNNASGRMAVSGTTRTIQATNGWFVSTPNQGVAILQNLASGVSVEFIGKWRLDANFGNGFAIVTSIGGNATFRTVGNDPTAILFDCTLATAYPVISTSWATGTLTTVGRINVAVATQQYSIVTMSSGTWSHTSTGVNVIGGSAATRIAVVNGGTINWTGSVTNQSRWDNSGLFAVLTGTSGNTIGQAGDVFTVTGGTNVLTAIVAMSGSGAVELTGKFVSTSKAVAVFVNAGTLRYRNQSMTVNSGEDLSIYSPAGSIDLTGLAITNSGKVGIISTGGSTITTSAGTLITNQSTSATACATGTTALDGKIITLPSPAPTLPAVQNVAAGTVYGYAASQLTGTGLIVDPATLASAVRTGVGLAQPNLDTQLTTITNRLPTALVGGRMDSVAANLDALVNSTQSQVLERSLQDNKPINITWPTTGATITATVSINNGSFVPTVGTVSFLRTESTGKHVYALSYNAADRPPAEGQARYVVTDGTYTRSFALRVENQGVPPVGSRSVAITVRDTGNVAIQGATVRLERAGYSYTLTTNASGLVTFSVDDATYTVTITAGGFSFTPVSLVVGGNVTQTYQMTASTVSPSAPPYTTGFWTVLDLNGVAQANAQVTIQAANPPKDSTGLVLEDAPRTATANGSGVVQFTNLVKGATYIVYRTGSTRKFNVTVPANAGNTAALGSIVG